MEKKKSSANFMLGIVCALLILVFGVGCGVCFANIYHDKMNREAKTVTEPVVKNQITKETEKTTKKEEVIEEEEKPEERETEEPEEEEKAKEVADKFVEAVNNGDMDEVRKYSSDAIVEELEKYNVSNMSIKEEDWEKWDLNPSKPDLYKTICHYDFEYEGMTAKDLSLGNIFEVEKINGEYKVTCFSATGP